MYVRGGRTPTRIDAVRWAAAAAERLGAGEILLTSMDGDGYTAGYDIELTHAVADAVTIPVIASGGAGTLAHFAEALTDGSADAALAGITLPLPPTEHRRCQTYLASQHIPS